MKNNINKIYYAVIFTAVIFTQLFFATKTFASVVSKEPTNLGLVGYWSFNEGTSTMAHDFSGNGNNGVFVNSPSWIFGKREGGLSFNGTTQYVIDTNASNLPAINGAKTFAAWIQVRGSSGGSQDIIVLTNSTSPSAGDQFSVSSAGKLIVSQWGGTLTIASNQTLSTNIWYFVTYTFNGTTNSLYINGVLDNTSATASQSGSGVTLTVGKYPNGTGGSGGGEFFNGYIDEVRIYNRALSASEITTIYKSGSTKITAANTTSGGALAVNTEDKKLTKGLTGFWSFNALDMSGASAFDLSGQGNNVTLTGSPTAVAGMVGQALSFNGSTMSGASGSNIGITGAAPRTINAWVNYTSLPSSFSAFAGWGTQSTNQEFQLADEGGCTTKYLTIWLYGTSCADLDSTTVPIPGQWYMVTGVYDGTTASIYVNGVKQGNRTVTLNTGNSTLELANGFSKSNAKLDEVRVYNRAITPSEIQELYQTGLVTVNGSQTNRVMSGLAGYWTFDGKNMNWGSNTATDSSGNGGTGTLTNMSTTTSPVAGRVGQALHFNGTTSYVNVSPVPSLTSPLTVSAWVYPTSLSQAAFSGSTFGGTIIDEDENGGSAGWVLGIRNDNKIWFWPKGGQDKFSTGTVPLNKWTFVSATYDGTSLRLYINGVLDSTQTMVAPDGSATFFKIGAKAWITGAWAGNLDEVRVYNTTLSATQVTQLYLAGH